MNNPGFSGSSNGDILKPLESHALSYSKAHCLLSGVSESVPTICSCYFTISLSIFLILITYVLFSCWYSCGFVVAPPW